MKKNNFSEKIEKLNNEFLDLLMERCEYPEVAILYERFRDFIDDTNEAMVSIKAKEIGNSFN